MGKRRCSLVIQTQNHLINSSSLPLIWPWRTLLFMEEKLPFRAGIISLLSVASGKVVLVLRVDGRRLCPLTEGTHLSRAPSPPLNGTPVTTD